MTDATNQAASFQAWVRARAAAIQIRPETFDRVVHLLGQRRANALYKDWRDDAIGDPHDEDTRYTQALQAPDADFQAWLADRFRDPFAVSYRHLRSAVRHHGDPAWVTQYLCEGWPAELDLAGRDRREDDDGRAVIAQFFLEVARRQPGRVFRALVDLNCERTTHEPGVWHPDPSAPERGVVPSYVVYIQRTHGDKIREIQGTRLQRFAYQARMYADRVTIEQRRDRCTAELVRRPLTHSPAVIASARQKGLDADQLCERERSYATEIVRAQIDPPKTDLPTAFVAWLAQNAEHAAPRAPEAQAAWRRRLVADLDADWLSRVPADMHPGGDVETTFDAWKDAVVNGRRTPARDPVLDFVMYAKETRRLVSADSG